MSANARPEIDELLQEALKAPADERPSFIDRLCGDDSSLRADLEGLLAAHAQAGDFLDQPAVTIDGPGPAHLSEGPGTVIDRYKILQQIGEGGFGVVYMAEQKQPVDRRVALKIIKLGMDTKQVIARFEAERQALALMDHPNIARVLDAGATETGRPYFVMELVKGVPITEYCDKNKLNVRDRLALFQKVCHAIQHAHQKGIIHRDLKPSNVLVTLHDGQPVPKVIDFGIAKATTRELTEKTVFTEFRQLIGTPEYMSPEQAEMSGLDIDTRSDVYSLGVLLYELLTGVTPFDAHELRGAGYAEIQRIISEKQPAKPSTRVSTLASLDDIAAHRQSEPRKLGVLIRGDLDWIVMKAMEKDRTRRYDTANGLAMDIQRHLDDQPVSAGPPSASYRLRKFVHRNRIGVGIATSMAAILILGFSTALIGLRQAQEGRKAAEISKAKEEEERLRILRLQDFLVNPNIIVMTPRVNEHDLETESLGSSLARNIIDELDRTDGVKAPSYDSIRKLESLGWSADRIASELNANGIMTGSINRVGDELTFDMRIDLAGDDFNYWRDSWSGRQSEAFLLQHDVSDGVVHALKREPPVRDTLGGTANPEARKAYNTASHIIQAADRDGIRNAIAYYDQAIALDPTFALAYLGKANAYLQSATLGTVPAEANEPALAAAEMARQIEPRLAGAWAAIGQVKFHYGYDWDAARIALERALELDPYHAGAHAAIGAYYASIGEFDLCVDHVKKAIELDPTTLLRHESVMYAPYFARRMDVAIEICEHALQMDDQFWSPHAWMGLALAWEGELDAAIVHGEEAYRLEADNPVAIGLLASVYAMKGRKEQDAASTSRALELLQVLIDWPKSDFICPYEIATVFLALGDSQTAFDYLEETYDYMTKAVNARAECIPFAYVDVRLDEWRLTNDFQEVMSTVDHPLRGMILEWQEG